MIKEDLLRRVRQRMATERLTQRDLADKLGTTQGHLSKVLRGRYARRSRIVRELEGFVGVAIDNAGARPLEAELLAAARVAATPGRDTSGHVLIRVEPDVRWCTAEEMAEAERRAVARTGRVLVAWLIGRWRR